jgi:hypothetical protein
VIGAKDKAMEVKDKIFEDKRLKFDKKYSDLHSEKKEFYRTLSRYERFCLVSESRTPKTGSAQAKKVSQRVLKPVFFSYRTIF